MKTVLLGFLIVYLLVMGILEWRKRQKKDLGPSFRPWEVRLKPRQKKK